MKYNNLLIFWLSVILLTACALVVGDNNVVDRKQGIIIEPSD